MLGQDCGNCMKWCHGIMVVKYVMFMGCEVLWHSHIVQYWVCANFQVVVTIRVVNWHFLVFFFHLHDHTSCYFCCFCYDSSFIFGWSLHVVEFVSATYCVQYPILCFIYQHMFVMFSARTNGLRECWLVSGVHLHELLEGSDVHLPEPVVPPRVISVVFHSWITIHFFPYIVANNY